MSWLGYPYHARKILVSPGKVKWCSVNHMDSKRYPCDSRHDATVLSNEMNALSARARERAIHCESMNAFRLRDIPFVDPNSDLEETP